jgi:hypothetical protein
VSADHVGENGRVAPLLIVDSANVVGSIPDGWWRDPVGAAERLRDCLAPVAATGLSAVTEELTGPLDVVMVVEGAARGVESSDGVRVVAASGSGDDTIVELVRPTVGARVCAVVTADRGLRERVSEFGAYVLGPRTLPYTGRRG